MNMLSPNHKINPPQWMRAPDLLQLLEVLNTDTINARMVGGCIRNTYFNKPVYDIDIACKYSPETTMEKCRSANIKIIPTGIKHGTVTAHINGHNFEITTLRRDINTDGRHADIKFTEDWHEDALRRDFTVNALYADIDGSIYDPLGTGLSDIQNKTIRFIGNPEERIEEDYLRILRFFRFYAEFNVGEIDTKSYEACIKNKQGINSLSEERICDELLKILDSTFAYRAIEAMHEADFFDIQKVTANQLKNLINLQQQLDRNDIYTRYYLTLKDKKYIKNSKILCFFKKLDSFTRNWSDDLKLSLYLFDRVVITQGLLFLKATGKDVSDVSIARSMTETPPQLPIVASDIMQNFKIEQGPQVGKKLKEAEALWIESKFTLSRHELLDQL